MLSEAYGAETNLNWLDDHSEIVIQICANFKTVLTTDFPDEDKQAAALKELRNSLVSEPREFIQMLETVRGSLRSWTVKVDRRDVNLQEWTLLQRHADVYNHVAYLLSAKDALLQVDILHKVKVEYDDVKEKLSNLLIRTVPSCENLGW